MRYITVDTFTTESGQGSPVTIFLDVGEISLERMRELAAEAGLPTAVFVFPPTDGLKADYRVRIISRQGTELPFAGHSSMGAAFALVKENLLPNAGSKIVQECPGGLITIQRQGDVFQFAIKNASAIDVDLPLNSVKKCFAGVEIENAGNKYPLVNVGPKWLILHALGGRKRLLSALPDLGAIYSLSNSVEATGVCVYAEDEDGVVEVRSFAPGFGEEFVCGSGNASVAYVRRAIHGAKQYRAFQGEALGRPGEIAVSYDDMESIWVGGPCLVERSGEV